MHSKRRRGNSARHRENQIINEINAPVAAGASRKPASRTPAILMMRWKPILVVVAVIFVAWLTYGYIHTKHQLENLSSSGQRAAGQSEAQQLVNQVGNLVQLPAGETPTLATVNDASKLKNQAFFASAQNGDKVLIFSKANKAVLYRPSTKKVIEFSTVNLSGAGQ